MVEPSLSAMKSTALLLRWERTHPFTFISLPKSVQASASTTFILFIANQILFKHAATQYFYFFLSKESPIASAQVLLCQTGELNTVKTHYTIAKALENTAHNAVLSTVNLNAYLTFIVLIGILYRVCMDFTILQLYAFSYLLQVSLCHGLIKMRSEEHTSELQSRQYLVCRLLLE